MPRRLGLTACLLLLVCFAGALHAQEAPAPAAAAAPAKQGPEPVAATDVPSRADADERFAQDVLERVRGKQPTAKLEQRMTALVQSVGSEAKVFKRDELQTLSIARLESFERHWKFYARQLEEWRRDLRQAMDPYNEDAAELARRRASWEKTLEADKDGRLPEALRNRIAAVVAQLSVAEQALSGPIEQQLRLSRSANAVETSIRAGQRAVDAAIAYSDHRLMMVDSPPLWEAWTDPAAAGSGLEALKRGLELEGRFLAEYNEANADFLRYLNVAAFLLLPLLLWLGRRSRKVQSDDPEIQASTRVLQRPFSSWIVLCMVGLVMVEPDAPMLRHQVAFLLALVPVLRLLPPAVHQVLGPWPYIATGLYLLHRLSFLFVGNLFYHRVYLLALGVLAALLLVWVLWRRSRRTDIVETRAHRITRFVGWVAVAGLVVAVVANLVGNVSLAEMLTAAIIDSGYVGLVLYAGATVLASVLRLLLARRALSRFSIVTQHAGPLLQSFTRLLKYAAVAAWVVVLLHSFRVFRPLRDAVEAFLTHEFRFGQISLTLGGVLLFVFSVWLAFWVAKTTRLILREDVLPKMSLPRGVGNSISSLSYYALLLVGLLVALAAAGFETSQLAIVFGAVGLGVGLGLQNVVNNFVSGLILMFERPIQPGDVVEVSGTSGTVREIGMRATTLTTFEGADVVVPNGALLNEKLINWTLSDMNRRIDVNVGVNYGADARRVLEVLKEVTQGTPGIAQTPAPNVLFIGFGANSLDFGIRAWTNNFGEWVGIRSELTIRVLDALRAAGIEIPYPQQDLHLRTVAPEALASLRAVQADTAVKPRAERRQGTARPDSRPDLPSSETDDFA
ncbi:MAG: mechanosensitive ion channel protein MscS [Lysobacterales bacterium]|nr:MAG: mechanosensitive ion channel protein MscS [Xanthomonadales bacterium]